MIEETKFIISGRFERANGYVMRDELAYISETKEQAIATCQRNHPNFHIHTVRVDDTVPEIVRPQRLIWISWQSGTAPPAIRQTLCL